MNIYGQSIFLRSVEKKDAEKLMLTINDPETERMVGGWGYPASSEDQLIWIENINNDTNNKRWIIEAIDTGESVGLVNLLNIDWKNRCAFHGIKLWSDAPKRKGYATDATMTLMYYAFEQLGMNRMEGSIVEYNEPSLRLYTKCGFQIEGTKRRYLFKDNKYYDQYLIGILREEYFEIKEKLGWHSKYEIM